MKFLPQNHSTITFLSDYDPEGDNKWEIDDGIRALKHLPALIAILRPHDVPRDLNVPGTAGTLHSGISTVIPFKYVIPTCMRSLSPGLFCRQTNGAVLDGVQHVYPSVDGRVQ